MEPTSGYYSERKYKRNNINELIFCTLVRKICAYWKSYTSSFDHTTVDIPYPIRTAKSSTVGPNQYCGGGPRGNLGCRMFFFFGPFLTMFWSKTWTWRPIVNIPLPHFFGKQADLWRMLGISNCFFTLFFCFNPRLCGFFFLVLRTCLFLVLPHSMAPFTLNFTETKLSKQMQLSGQT